MIGFGAFTLTSCKGKQKEKQKDEKVEVKEVRIAELKKDKVLLNVTYTCLLEPKTRNNITAQNGGRLEKLFVEVGTKVAKGQVLARLEGTMLQQAKIRLDEAKRNFKRLDELYKIGAVAKVQWEQAKSNYDIALEQEKNLATNTLLRSPISGVVTARNYDEGDLTSPQRPVLVVENLSEIKAIINVSEQYYSFLKVGLSASLELDALAGDKFKATITKVYPTVDARTHTVKVELLVSNKAGKLRTGMFARLKLNLGEREVLLVPDVAVHKVLGSGSRYVYLYQKEGESFRAVYKEVKLGELYGSNYEVLAGLSQGQKLVVSASNQITDGTELIAK